MAAPKCFMLYSCVISKQRITLPPTPTPTPTPPPTHALHHFSLAFHCFAKKFLWIRLFIFHSLALRGVFFSLFFFCHNVKRGFSAGAGPIRSVRATCKFLYFDSAQLAFVESLCVSKQHVGTKLSLRQFVNAV